MSVFDLAALGVSHLPQPDEHSGQMQLLGVRGAILLGAGFILL